eukprot:CAMPEP_0177791260 /NCGR_PEP_ID=MMETSP0491_2-20121128/23830_1 /TAXON_ID=63592 /ORGANISM="Tetraselmis chuii, Strain PLY429" /LENGTH=134 /DNA_ID=CAMNT_0019313463 /DNA_START=11 /DNA_END=412 /DNA_ORIENTATION=-
MGCNISKDSGTAGHNDEARRPPRGEGSRAAEATSGSPKSPLVPGGNSTDRPTASDGHQFDAFTNREASTPRISSLLMCPWFKRLLNAGVRIWIDEDHLNHGHIKRELIRGVDASRFVVVFITSEYLRKIASEDS